MEMSDRKLKFVEPVYVIALIYWIIDIYSKLIYKFTCKHVFYQFGYFGYFIKTGCELIYFNLFQMYLL